MRTFFFLNKSQTILSAYLDLLNVKHTKKYADKLYNEHPYKYSLFGLSKMLSEYKIPNAGIEILNKESGLKELEVPFIAYAGNEFVLVYEKDNEKISYLWQNKQINIGVDYFKNIWSGIVLIAEAEEESIEQNYIQNYRREWKDRVKTLLLLVITSSLLVFSCVDAGVFSSIIRFLLLFFNLLGLYVCTLLLMKQIHIQSQYADKICSLFKKSDCNNILESKDAKLWGVISWSEIGFGYFCSNLIIFLWFPFLMEYSVLIGCCTLIFSFWSIWYQKVKVKQWCPLCLVIQLLFWLLFVLYLIGGFIPAVLLFSIESLFIVGCIYSILILVVSFICPKLGLDSKIQNLVQQTNSLRMRDEVIAAILKTQLYHKVDITNSKIFFGNPQAKIWITILTNPHCEPCGFMHRRVENLLNKVGEKICIQYIFSSFNEELGKSNKQLIAVYLNHTMEEVNVIFHDWFTGGKYKKDDFYQCYPQNLEDENVNEEFERHNKWKEETGITVTPTIWVNGYMLPRNYRIEDIVYFVDNKDIQSL